MSRDRTPSRWVVSLVVGLVLAGLVGLWLTLPAPPRPAARLAVAAPVLQPLPPRSIPTPQPEAGVPIGVPDVGPEEEAYVVLSTVLGRGLIRCDVPPDLVPPSGDDVSFQRIDGVWFGQVFEPSGWSAFEDPRPGAPPPDVVMTWGDARPGVVGTCVVSRRERAVARGRWVGPSGIEPMFSGCLGVEVRGNDLSVEVYEGTTCRVAGIAFGTDTTWSGDEDVSAGVGFELVMAVEQRTLDEQMVDLPDHHAVFRNVGAGAYDEALSRTTNPAARKVLQGWQQEHAAHEAAVLEEVIRFSNDLETEALEAKPTVP